MIKRKLSNRRSLVFSLILCFAPSVSFTAVAATPTDVAPETPKQKFKKTPVDVKGTQPQPNAEGVAPGPNAKSDGVTHVHSLRGMFQEGRIDGNIRFYDFTSHNAFFARGKNQNTGSYGGKLGLTTAKFYGFSLRLAAYVQRGIDHTEDTVDTAAFALAPDITALGEAYLQWQDQGVRVRVGNQRLDAPFTSSLPGFRIVPPTFQGATLRFENDNSYLTAMRIFRYKSYIDNEFTRTTTYNERFSPFGSNTNTTTDGFWAIGAGHKMNAGTVDIKGQAWFFNYKDYANMFYTDAQITRAAGSLKPFLGLQFIHERETGRKILGDINHYTYGVQLGVKHKSLTATLNYDYIPHNEDAFQNGSLVTPYAHNVASGPYFAQPFLNTTQDLGSGSAYSADVNGSPMSNTSLGARYSYMDLVPAAGADSIGQSEYLVYGIYNFTGALNGFSVTNYFAYQTRDVAAYDFWQNRVQLEYKF